MCRWEYSTIDGSVHEVGRNIENPHALFASPDTFASTCQTDSFLATASESLPLREVSLVIHNGDSSLNHASVSELAKEFAALFVVNLDPDLPAMPNIFPIPIGLENYPWRGEPYLRFFLECSYASPDPTRSMERPATFHASFSTHTNRQEREPLERLLAANGITNERTTWRSFSQLLLTTKFIFSPPGNGLDCHRTWEAIYAGCVPIVVRGTLPETLTDGLPIWVVDHWNDPLSLGEGDLSNIFAGFSGRRSPTLGANHWLGALQNVNALPGDQ